MEINEKFLIEKFEALDKRIENILVDERIKAYNEGFKSGKTHEQPAPTTAIFISETKSSINVINEDVREIKEILKTVPTEKGMKLMVNEAIAEAICKCDTKYASKKTEESVDRVAILIIVGFIGALLYLVFPKVS
jgi:hypothetical protein